MSVKQGVATDSLNCYPGPLCPTRLHLVGRPPLNRPYNRFRGGPLAERAACGRLLPFWTPHVVRPRRTPTEISSLNSTIVRNVSIFPRKLNEVSPRLPHASQAATLWAPVQSHAN
jgi:hypothetical protein